MIAMLYYVKLIALSIKTISSNSFSFADISSLARDASDNYIFDLI